MVDEQLSQGGSPFRGRLTLPRVVYMGLGLLAFMLFCLAAASRSITQSFSELEAGNADKLGHQLQQAFIAEMGQMRATTGGYAVWDDAADFVATGSRTFIDTNFTAAVLSTMHVDVALIVDASGHELYSGMIERGTGELLSPAPRELVEQLPAALASHAQRNPLDADQRLLHTNRGLLAYAVEPIRRSDNSHATGAMLLFGRFFYAPEMQDVRSTFNQDYGYSYLPAPLTTESLAGLPADVVQWIKSPPASHVRVSAPAASQLVTYTLMHDIQGRPAAIFTSSIGRKAYQLGAQLTRAMLTGIGMLLVLATIAVMWLLRRLQNSFDAAHAAELRYSRIAALLAEGITIIEAESGRILTANEAVLGALGCNQESIRSRSAFDLYPDLRTEDLETVVHSGERELRASRMRAARGQLVDAEVSISRMPDAVPPQLCLVGRDVTHRRVAEEQQRRSQRKLAHMAQHDPLTTLPNRLYLRSRLPRALRHSANSDKLLALIYLDIDHFKNINDSRGHAVGDQLLQVVARRLRAAVAAHDVVVRMGGDEFVIVGSLLPDRAAAEALAQRLVAAIQAPLSIDDASLEVSASMGVAIHPEHGLDMDSLLKHADIALYEAKAAGRRCYRLFSQDMQLRVSENVALEQALRRAVGTQQMSMDYQPVIDLRTGRVASLEALMRWRHPELGPVPPSQFIPVAESCGLMIEIGTQALREVIAQLREWIDAEVPLVPVAVNVSPGQLEHGDFDKLVMRMTSEAGVDPRWLRFEITETALLKDPEGLVATLQTLRTLGSQVLIDDFGTGYSGLSYLTRLPVDALKIDRSFVSDLGRNTGRTPIIGAVIDMARRLKLATVAEGVETAEQATLLRDQGCDFAQGYHFSKPVTARHCRTLLEQLNWERPISETLVVRVMNQ
jgi:diguanylate cyclase (GGDEF)-like protein/PAS domain S-box-containing protein